MFLICEIFIIYGSLSVKQNYNVTTKTLYQQQDYHLKIYNWEIEI